MGADLALDSLRKWLAGSEPGIFVVDDGDLGYAIGALAAGITADLLGLAGAMWVVAGLTFAWGLVIAFRMRETLRLA